MIEEIKMDSLDKPKEPKSKSEYTEDVIKTATLDTLDFDKNSKLLRTIEVTNIYNDNNDFVIETNYKSPNDIINKVDGTIIRVSRDLMKKLIYDLYLK